jgi:hypothetical protein
MGGVAVAVSGCNAPAESVARPRQINSANTPRKIVASSLTIVVSLLKERRVSGQPFSHIHDTREVAGYQ